MFENGGHFNGRQYTIQDILDQDRAHTQVMRDSFSTTHPSSMARAVSAIAQEAALPISNLAGRVYQIQNVDPSLALDDIKITLEVA